MQVFVWILQFKLRAPVAPVEAAQTKSELGVLKQGMLFFFLSLS